MVTVTLPPGRPSVTIDNQNEKIHRRALAATLQGAMQGHINCTVLVTLTASATSSTVIDSRISAQSACILAPMTAHAAADAGTIYCVPSNGQVVINHTSNANTDRTFMMAIIG
jgi:hypothetical protein